MSGDEDLPADISAAQADELLGIVSRALERHEPLPAVAPMLVADAFQVLHLDAQLATIESDTLVGGAPVRSGDAVDRRVRLRQGGTRIDVVLDAALALVGRVTPPGPTSVRVVGDDEQLVEVDDHGRFLASRPSGVRFRLDLLGGPSNVSTDWIPL